MTVEVNKIEWANALLEGVARKIQLNKSEHTKAVERYHLIAAYLTGLHTEILGLSPVIYPQGSFRTRSTVSSYRDDDYDIDLILEMNIDHAYKPTDVIDFIGNLMEQGRGQLKYERVEKKRRCVTLRYAGMHLDITPAVLIDPNSSRLISIFDTHPDRSDHVLANPEGFARWFDQRVLPSEVLQKYSVQARTFPVPDQEPLEEKPLRILSLQLLKRYRDITCDAGNYERCPSVLLSKLAANAPQSAHGGLVADLTLATKYVRDSLDVSEPYEENPACNLDLLTDRWPAQTKAHKHFVRDLDSLLLALGQLTGSGTLGDKQKLLEGLFGERAARSVFEDVQKDMARRAQSGLLTAAKVSGAISAPNYSSQANSNSLPIKPHKFFGS